MTTSMDSKFSFREQGLYLVLNNSVGMTTIIAAIAGT